MSSKGGKWGSTPKPKPVSGDRHVPDYSRMQRARKGGYGHYIRSGAPQNYCYNCRGDHSFGDPCAD